MEAQNLLNDAINAYPDYLAEIRQEVIRWAYVYPTITFLELPEASRP